MRENKQKANTVVLPSESGPLATASGAAPEQENQIITLVTNLEQEAEGEELVAKKLRAYLSSAIPDQDHHLELAFMENMAEGFSDSVSMHLPGYSAMMTSEEANVELHSRYARKVFRTTATAQQKKIIHEYPRGTIDQVMSSIHDLGVFFGHFKDAYDRSERGLLHVSEDQEKL